MMQLFRPLRACVFALLTVGFLAGGAEAAIVDLDWRNPLTNNNATINIGDTVRWTWRDTLTHTVTSLDGTSFDSGRRSGMGTTFQFTFRSAGSFNYRCEVHPGSMTGRITVRAAAGESPEYLGHTGNQVTNLDSSTSANNFPDIQVGFSTVPFAETGGTENQIVCLVTARLLGVKVRPSSVTLGGQLISLDGANLGSTIGNLPQKTRPFNPDGRFSWGFPDLSGDFDDPDSIVVRVLIEGSVNGGQQIDLLKTKCRAQNRLKCVKTGNRACVLAGNRYKMNLLTSSGRLASVTSNPPNGNNATFSISGGTVVAKVLNGCNNNDHFWVEIDPMTPAAFTLVVEDTQTGEVVSFMNPGKVVTDMAAFATCP